MSAPNSAFRSSRHGGILSAGTIATAIRAGSTLEAVILGEAPTMAPRPLCTMVMQRQVLHPQLRTLRAAVAQAASGDCVAYGVALDTPLLTRLMLVATMRFQLWRVERTIAKGGGEVVARYGVDPNLEAPACVYQLNSPASTYADRCLRPRGSAVRLRRLVTRWFGCDPALGGIVIIGKKPCC